MAAAVDVAGGGRLPPTWTRPRVSQSLEVVTGVQRPRPCVSATV
ncbi:hypothetical protein [Tepidiforma sp.]|nr:hypothetical protein [Tepidiforma sp.]